ncbi:hypothetical protein JIN85_20480 [Luteolibacter pohnpeiensis]|uniref:Uncharacterized protein n=1 Tax=Luteolibacter pohnpeiensis TaxID=454153 RepID=A0A934VYE1_9BACT|nr:hypothetical protein [Luteolibacter pohnpeiensis]MBK1884798.1 hypothetical protein [Luteolibacter pohnpeiensis]
MLSTAFGRIGANVEKCHERYGQPWDVMGTKDVSLESYGQGGIQTVCRFVDGVCVAVAYNLKTFTIVNDSISPTGPRFDAKQISQLLNLNRGTSEWIIETSNPRGGPVDGTYVTKDQTKRASVSFAGIRIEDIAWSNSERAKVESDKLQHAVDAITSEDPKDHSGE